MLVNSPVTAEGVIKSVLPLPLDVLMVVSSNTHSVPSPVERLAGSRAGLRRDGPVPSARAGLLPAPAGQPSASALRAGPPAGVYCGRKLRM